MLYMSNEGLVYSGDRQGEDRLLSEAESSLFLKGKGYGIQNGEIVDISQTVEYIAQQTAYQNTLKKIELQKQIDEIDFKRIRAIAEPQLKDEVSGQTWLEFYTNQISDLRAQISALV